MICQAFMIELFSFPLLLVYAFLFGTTMKIADALDEHGLKWFKGAPMLFGVLWGLFGFLLIIANPIIANVLLARILSYLPRVRLDYANHGVAATIIIIGFMYSSVFIPTLFVLFFVIFLLFGMMRDYYGKRTKTLVYKITEPAFHYILFTLVYSIAVKDFTLFWVFTVSQLSYDLVKYGFYHTGLTREP